MTELNSDIRDYPIVQVSPDPADTYPDLQRGFRVPEEVFMIYCINHKTIAHFGGAWVSQFQLRYRLLVDKQYWEVGRYQGMEYDQYDTPAATYLVWQDIDGVVRGSVRTVPTDRPYMLKDLWPDMIETMSLPNSLSVWEATRFCIDDDLPVELRQRIKHELVCAFMEFGLKNDIQQMIGVMPMKLWQKVFIDAGWNIEFLGKEKKLDSGDVIVAGLMPISLDNLARVRQTTGVGHPVLLTMPLVMRQSAQLPSVKDKSKKVA